MYISGECIAYMYAVSVHCEIFKVLQSMESPEIFIMIFTEIKDEISKNYIIKFFECDDAVPFYNY